MQYLGLSFTVTARDDGANPTADAGDSIVLEFDELTNVTVGTVYIDATAVDAVLTMSTPFASAYHGNWTDGRTLKIVADGVIDPSFDLSGTVYVTVLATMNIRPLANASAPVFTDYAFLLQGGFYDRM